MRIALDARTIYRPQRRGTGKNLIDLYRRLAQVRPDWHVIAYHRQEGDTEQLLPAPWAEPKLIEMPGDRISAWERFRLPMAAWCDGADVLHCPANTCPHWMPVNTIVTIHDLIPLDLPEDRPLETVKRFAQSVRDACRRAAWIITPSLYTSERLVHEFGADSSRITVNPWAADGSVYHVPNELWQPVLDCYGITRPYVLHFGASEARKNTYGVLEAWAQLPASLRDQWRLLVVGLDPRSLENFGDFAALRGVRPSVILHEFARESDLPTLLSAADVLAFPSLAEGYGLPILDAWATRTAVLTSNTTSLPEVAGDAALLVDPTDPAAIGEALIQLMTDAALRASLVDRGTRRLAQFSWSATVERFVTTIEKNNRPGQTCPVRRMNDCR